MSRWDDLYARFDGPESRRGRSAQRADEDREALAAFAEWCEAATRDAMSALHHEAVERAHELEHRCARRVAVTRSEHAVDGTSVTALRFALDGTEVLLYAHRGPGALPFLHFIPLGRSDAPRGRGRRQRRMVSLPGAFVARRADDSWELRRIRVPGTSAHASDTLTVDDLVFRAFELLLRGADARPLDPRTQLAL